jgi:hypothetical protein
MGLVNKKVILCGFLCVILLHHFLALPTPLEMFSGLIDILDTSFEVLQALHKTKTELLWGYFYLSVNVFLPKTMCRFGSNLVW